MSAMLLGNTRSSVNISILNLNKQLPCMYSVLPSLLYGYSSHKYMAGKAVTFGKTLNIVLCLK